MDGWDLNSQTGRNREQNGGHWGGVGGHRGRERGRCWSRGRASGWKASLFWGWTPRRFVRNTVPRGWQQSRGRRRHPKGQTPADRREAGDLEGQDLVVYLADSAPPRWGGSRAVTGPLGRPPSPALCPARPASPRAASATFRPWPARHWTHFLSSFSFSTRGFSQVTILMATTTIKATVYRVLFLYVAPWHGP